MALEQDGPFKGRHFTSEVVLWALCWQLAFPIGYRDLAAMLADCGAILDYTTVFRWMQTCAATLVRRIM